MKLFMTALSVFEKLLVFVLIPALLLRLGRTGFLLVPPFYLLVVPFYFFKKRQYLRRLHESRNSPQEKRAVFIRYMLDDFDPSYTAMPDAETAALDKTYLFFVRLYRRQCRLRQLALSGVYAAIAVSGILFYAVQADEKALAAMMYACILGLGAAALFTVAYFVYVLYKTGRPLSEKELLKMNIQARNHGCGKEHIVAFFDNVFGTEMITHGLWRRQMDELSERMAEKVRRNKRFEKMARQAEKSQQQRNIIRF